jgi:hypothetical protein
MIPMLACLVQYGSSAVNEPPVRQIPFIREAFSNHRGHVRRARRNRAIGRKPRKARAFFVILFVVITIFNVFVVFE